jgi:hypothetical protein
VDRPLYSERAGRARALSPFDFAGLVWSSVVVWARAKGLFAEALDMHKASAEGGLVPGRVGDVNAFLLDRLKTSDVRHSHLMSDRDPPLDLRDRAGEDILFDLLELLHDQCVSKPARREPRSSGPVLAIGPFDREDGQQMFREHLNPELAKHSPPLEMRANGHITELPPEELRPLVEEPIPDSVEPELRDPIGVATDRFFRRGATQEDRLASLRELAGVLERLRPRLKEEMFSRDEAALFAIANGFAIRHHDRAQRGDYNKAIWLEWIFYVFLATAKTTVRIEAQRGPGGPNAEA